MKFKIINFMKIYIDNFTKASLSGSGNLPLQLHTAFEMSEQPFIYRLGQNPTQAFAAEESIACHCRTPLPFYLPYQRITTEREHTQAFATWDISTNLMQSRQALPQPI
nr:hypothetical protein [Pseudomonas sp. NFPP33]